MKTNFCAQWFFTLCVISLFFSSCADNEETSLPVENGYLSVVNVSGKPSLPQQLTIDGANGGKNSYNLANLKEASHYELVQSGVRKLSIGGYEDTVHIQKDSYYTLLVFDKDSVQITYDNNGGGTQFTYMPMVRWNLVGNSPADYRVHIFGDSLIRNIPVNDFHPFSTSLETVTVRLFAKNNLDQELGEQVVAVQSNKKVTVNIQYNADENKYTFTPITQSVNQSN